jgi:hypothetical protein
VGRGRWGLVQEDDARLGDQGHRQIEPAAHAPGVGRCRLSARIDQVEAFQQLRRSPPALELAQVLQVGDQDQVLRAGEQTVDRRELAGDTDHGAHGIRIAGHIVAGDPHLAAVGGDERGEDLDRRGLARPIRAEQGEDGSFRDLQVDAVEHDVIAERLAQADGLEGRPHRSGRHASPPVEPAVRGDERRTAMSPKELRARTSTVASPGSLPSAAFRSLRTLP